MEYDLIVKRFMEKLALMGKLSVADEQLVINGMTDVLDAIGDVHPELVYFTHTIRANIENAIDLRDDGKAENDN